MGQLDVQLEFISLGIQIPRGDFHMNCLPYITQVHMQQGR
mgnify:CR=1 FL=1